MIKYFPALIALVFFGCSQKQTFEITPWQSYDESSFLEDLKDHENPRMRFKLIQSKHLDKNKIWESLKDQLVDFNEESYSHLKPFIYEKDIASIQSSIEAGNLSYKQLTQWYLYRIYKFENDSSTTLHTVISINENAVSQAEWCDKNKSQSGHPIFGIPVVLKDNINTKDIPTTAGAKVLESHTTPDAELVERLKNKHAIILAKVNLSEWAYYFCDGCPVGYSAVGGQTLNPYGRMVFETGGSSSGSATAVAANYAPLAVGSETSGSILSPSSQNSVVGLKPTVGKISGTGVVPISKTLDTAGPISKNVRDNVILYSALTSTADSMLILPERIDLAELKLGVFGSNYYGDSLYSRSVDLLKENGAQISILDNTSFNYDGFLTLLNLDMKNDLKQYLDKYGSEKIKVKTIEDIVEFNKKDSLSYMPYGQGRFDNILQDSTSADAFVKIKERLLNEGRKYLADLMQENDLDAIVSINNSGAALAAVAHYPCIAVPMGYTEEGEPQSMTFTCTSNNEKELLNIAYTYEQLSNFRKAPSAFED